MSRISFWHVRPVKTQISLHNRAVRSESSSTPHEETLHQWLLKMRQVKILISLRACADWSNYSLGAHVLQYVFLRWLVWFPAGILYNSTTGRYRPVSYSDGPITARYRFMKNAYWVVLHAILSRNKRVCGAKGCVRRDSSMIAVFLQPNSTSHTTESEIREVIWMHC